MKNEIKEFIKNTDDNIEEILDNLDFYEEEDFNITSLLIERNEKYNDFIINNNINLIITNNNKRFIFLNK